MMIRTAGEFDLDEIFALERAVAEAPHWTLEDYAALIRPDRAGAVRRCLLVAEAVGDEGVMHFVGFAIGKVIEMGEDSVGELESVVVAEGARRMGVGRALCGGVLKWCRERGAGTVGLEVRSRNNSARRLYVSLGFVEEGVRRNYYRDPSDDAVLMRLEVPRHSPGQR